MRNPDVQTARQFVTGAGMCRRVIHWYWLTEALFCDLSAWRAHAAVTEFVNRSQQSATLELV